MKRFVLLLFVFTVSASSFVQAEETPSDAVIKKAIETRLKSALTPRLAGSLLGSRTESVDSIEIVAKGKFNQKGGYWPVKAHVKGKCVSQELMSLKKRLYDGVEEFHILQDDYGKWYARYANPI